MNFELWNRFTLSFYMDKNEHVDLAVYQTARYAGLSTLKIFLVLFVAIRLSRSMGYVHRLPKIEYLWNAARREPQGRTFDLKWTAA